VLVRSRSNAEQQAFQFGPAGEKPKQATTQRKQTQRPTAARSKPADDKKVLALQATVKKLKESNRILEASADSLRRIRMQLDRDLSAMKTQNSLLWSMNDELGKRKHGGSIPGDMLARLIRLAHPDKHSNSPASNEATSWLLAQRKAR
jgi:hypothetical protein